MYGSDERRMAVEGSVADVPILKRFKREDSRENMRKYREKRDKIPNDKYALDYDDDVIFVGK